MSNPIPEGPPAVAVDLLDLMARPVGEVVLNPVLMQALRMDLTVTATEIQMPVESCTYTVRMSPGRIPVARDLAVSILLHDNFGNMANTTAHFGPEGGQLTMTTPVPIKDRSVLGGPDPGRWVYVVVDPCFAIAERNEGNNLCKAWCYTLG